MDNENREKSPGLFTSVRFFLALWAAKLTMLILKILGFHAYNRPGMVAMSICPHFLARMARPKTVIAVTGTNGKTTVANLLCDALTAAGMRVRGNRGGYNLYSGMISALLPGVGLLNGCRYDAAVVETDEHAARLVLPDLKPTLTVITNLCQDSLMRNAHAWFMADRLTAAIPAGLKLLLNADDLISSGVAPENPRAYFGIERMETDVTECVNRVNDVRVCPKCAGRMEFEYRRYHHIGRAHCVDCGFASPEYDYSARVDAAAGTLTLTDRAGSVRASLLSGNIYDMYNLTAAAAALRELGLDHGVIERALSGARVPASRHSEVDVGGARLITQLTKDKNAMGCSRVFEDITRRPEGDIELLMMFYNLEDERHWSENVCWTYDCDFEFLNNHAVKHIVIAGPRCKDYRLRLLLAGYPPERVEIEYDDRKAGALLHMVPGSTVYLLHGADTTDRMLKVREDLISAAGAGKSENVE